MTEVYSIKKEKENRKKERKESEIEEEEEENHQKIVHFSLAHRRNLVDGNCTMFGAGRLAPALYLRHGRDMLGLLCLCLALCD